MHGHAQSGSRKLNRHWQSGGKYTGGSGGGGSLLEENLIYFDRVLDPNNMEWEDGQPNQYFIKGPSDPFFELYTHEQYSKNIKFERSLVGFKPIVITRPGDYQVKWDLKFNKMTNRHKVSEVSYANKCGLVGVIMYSLGDSLSTLKTSPTSYNSAFLNANDKAEYYTGTVADYIADQTGSPARNASFYDNNEFVQYVNPSRSVTSGWFFGNNSFNVKSSNEVPPLILHIGGQAPFNHYEIAHDPITNDVYFNVDYQHVCPGIKFLFTYDSDSFDPSYAITGKIWLERVGDYTEVQEGWLPKITKVPEGYTILGNGGIIN